MTDSNQGNGQGPQGGQASGGPAGQPGQAVPPPIPPPGYPGYPPGPGGPYGPGPGAFQASSDFTTAGMKPVNIMGKQYLYAPYFDRALAFLLDGVIFIIPAMLMYAIVAFFIAIGFLIDGGDGGPLVGVFIFLGVIVGLAAFYGLHIWYFSAFLAKEMWGTMPGQTFGCKVLQMMIVKQDGSPLRGMDGFLRWLGNMASMMVMYLGFIWAIIDDRNQSWGDMLGKTYAVTLKPQAPVPGPPPGPMPR